MSEVTDEYIADARDRMKKSIEATVHNFGSIRTGRANPHLLDRIVVDYYGAQTPLKQLATINAPEARLLTVTPFDKNSMGEIEKAIRNSDLGLNPSNDGNVMRLTIPELTEERRRDMVKQARHIGEEGRVGIRNVRRDVMHDLRELKNEGEIGEDDERRAEADLQKLTDEKIAELDGILKGKEAEIMEV
jgi:ribosome recycling factor